MENKYKYDILKMYFGETYYVTDKLFIKQPSIGDIIEYGETKFWNVVGMLCANSTSLRLMLWDNGIDWNELDDFELFTMIIYGLDKNDTEILFGDIDFTKFKKIKNNEDKIVLVYMPDPTIQIDDEVYNRLVGYLRIMFNIHPKVEKAKGMATKEAIIFEERMNLKNVAKKQENEIWSQSTLFPLISAALNHPGFKYKKSELKEVGIVEFMDSVKRLQVYESVTSLMTGMYMGMIDTKKINLKEELNWTRDLYKD